ncbi:MAG TPA: lysine--tRNA ligase [Candidatus Dojkabacteria bacterium]|nr:lysine--tRNA ligase [Candidatus Dojkabacteria bacterium]
MNTQSPSSDLIGQRNVRIEKVKKLQQLGINPYPTNVKKEIANQKIREDFSNLENQKLWVAGRIMSLRNIGKIIFANLQDSSGSIQLYIKEDTIESTNISNQTLGWEHLNLLDIGDFVSAYGEVTKTKTGEISILVHNLQVASKTIRPLPGKWHGLDDIDERFRRRYLDMTMNPEIRQRFIRRASFWRNTRKFLDDNGFYEINIPVLEHVTGGADAKPFVTHYDALGQNLFLRISHELPLKRLLGGGFEKVYDLGPRFRNEGIDAEHLPEHIAMEFYSAYTDFETGIQMIQDMFQFILKETYGKLDFEIEGQKINLDGSWPQKSYEQAMKEFYGDIDIFNDSIDKLTQIYRKHDGKSTEINNRSRIVDALWKVVRKTIIQPIFITDVPLFLSPLSKKKDELRVNRVFPIIAGTEMANAFAELNDPIDQYERFVEQQKLRDAGDDEAQMLDIDFVEMLEYGMPPAFGFGMSERVFWIFEGISAREGVPFPQLKNDIGEVTKKIYKIK